MRGEDTASADALASPPNATRMKLNWCFLSASMSAPSNMLAMRSSARFFS
jgi:hypothetical protein